jgi:hypothetical protein
MLEDLPIIETEHDFFGKFMINITINIQISCIPYTIKNEHSLTKILKQVSILERFIGLEFLGRSEYLNLWSVENCSVYNGEESMPDGFNLIRLYFN